MDSKEEPDAESHRLHAVTENSGTTAQHKKRRRRVSFAEHTSIRFFDRDDEDFNGTPLVETAKIIDDSSGELGSGGLSERHKEFEGEDDGGDNNEDDEGMEMRGSFLRPIGSPSPGGSTFGSASSNDEEYFGPVSANFICRGLTDSAASDDNHDVTMDSTAFSMHFRSLARSDSGTDLKTPTAGRLTPTSGRLFFEEKTSTNSNSGSSMVVTLGKKPMNKSSVPVTEVSGSHNSNDMSLVGENRNMYEYEKLSPGLDALLVESQKNLLYVSVSDDITSVSPKRKAGNDLSSVNLGNNQVSLDDSVTEDTHMLNGDESAAHNEFGEANDPNGLFLTGPSPNRFSASTSGVAADRDNPKPNKSPHLLGKNEPETSLVVSTSSPVKCQEILLTTASPSKPRGAVSPLPEQPGSWMKNRSIEHEETETPIQKSISKLELIERSALSSIFSSKIDNSTVKSLDFFKSPGNSFKSNNFISRYNFGEDSVTGEKAASVHQSTRKLSHSMDHAKGENHLEGSLSQVMSGKSPNELSSKNIFADQSNAGTTAASPSKITWSGNNLISSLFMSKQNNEDSLMTETESVIAEIASGEGGQLTSPKFVSPPGRMLERTFSASPGSQSNQSEDLSVQSEIKQIAFDKGQDSTSERNLAHVNFSSEPANRCALSKGSKGESTFSEVNRLKLIESEAIDSRETDNHNMTEIIGNGGNLCTPAKENEIQVVHSKNLDVDNLTSRGFSSFEDIPGAVSKMVFHDFVSPSANRNLDQQRLQKGLEQIPAGSPSRKSLDNIHPSTITSQKDIQMSGGLELSANKRNPEILLRDTLHKSETNITDRSSRLQKGSNYEPETSVYPIEGRAKPTGQTKWTDTYSTFTKEMKILIFGSADELDSKMIDLLEDMLFHQQRSKVCEMLHHGVMYQNTIVHHKLQLEKVAEANSLLHRVVFEKAKLQLKNVKRDILLKRLGLLSSRMQESQILGADIAALPLEGCTSHAQVDAVGDGSLSVNLKKENEVCPERLTATRQSLEASDRKILNLTRTFHARCKMKAEPGIVDTITLVNEYLIKRASCRFIRLDMQMWVVQSVGCVNGQPYVLLNYLDLIVQSTKIIVGPTSTARTLFELNEKNIIKNFPNMDSSIAFMFVFNGETIRKYGGAKTLIQETQVTNSLLGTLLDVMEEVQLAHMEFQNLTQTSFCSPSVERLNLRLCFHNFDSGSKVCLTLDLSCLKRGIYPSEVLPLQTTPLVDSKKSSSSGPIFDEIRNAVKGVRSGYMRILRLCRCVSQVVQASTA